MRQTHSLVIFISIVFILSLLINYYVLSRLCGLFGIKKKAIFWAILFICSSSLIGSTIFQSYVGNIFSRILYAVSANWFGILWLLFSTLIIYEVLSRFFKINPSIAGFVIIAVVFLVTIYSMVNAQLIRIKNLTIRGNADFMIAQLSDIHMGSVSNVFLERIIEKTNTLNPDIVVITGDLVDNYNKTTQKGIGLLKKLKAPVLFVTGNHERYVGSEKVIKSLTEADVEVLRNQRKDYEQIQIIGISDNTDKKIVEQLIQKLHVNDSRFSILIYHRPIDAKVISKIGINLALTGHTHAGQIFPFNYIVGLSQRPLYGFFEYNKSYLYVTSGTGTWGPRMRLGTKSEIVLIKIRKSN